MTASAGNGPLPLGVEIALHCFVAALVRDRWPSAAKAEVAASIKASARIRIRTLFLSLFFNYRAADIAAQAGAKLQMKFHVQCACDWIRAVSGDLLETDFVVHRNRIFHHRFHGVEAHALVANLATLCDDLVRERAA